MKEENKILAKIDQLDQKFDKRFEQVNLKLEKHDKYFERIDKRFEQVDKRFDQLDQKFEKKFEKNDQKLEKIILKLLEFDEKIENVRSDFKKDFSVLHTAVDQYSIRADNYFQEMLVLSRQFDRHDKWIRQIADKIGIKLEI
jgi:CII-binding regulator of phage lambda lysogenization HflD